MPQTRNSQRDSLLWYLCAAVIVSGLWTASDVAGLVPPILLVGWAAFLRVFQGTERKELAATPPQPLGRPGSTQLLLGLVVAAPLVLWLVWFEPGEFPFIGDHNVHLRHLLSAMESWRGLWVVGVACLLLMLPKFRRAIPSWTPIAIVCLWLLAGLAVDPAGGFATRYPGSLHFLGVPIALARAALGLAAPLDALRLANVLALPGWLFVLRPLIVRRWPDVAVLPYALFLFFQKDVIYYVSGAYLEPWSMVMLALAVELIVSGEARDGWKAVLAAFAAPLIKEYTILLAPWIAVSAYLRAKEREERRNVLLSAGTGLALFLFYYTARLHSGVFGATGFDVAGIAPERLAGYADRASRQFGWALPIVIALLGALLWLATRRGGAWRTWAPLAAAIVAQNLYFLGETLTSEWLGYPRFQLPLLALLAAPLLRLPSILTTRARLLAASLVIAGAHLLAARPLIAAIGEPGMALNFFEHRDAPVYLPFRQLIDDAEARGWTNGVSRLRVLSNLHGVKSGYVPISLPLAYPEIAGRYAIEVATVDFSALDRCSCDSSGEAVVGLYVYFNGQEKPDAPVATIMDVAAKCHERIARSCASSFALRYRQQLVGSFGRGAAAPAGE